MPDDDSVGENHAERIKMLEKGFREMAFAFLAVSCEVSALQILLSKKRVIAGEQLQSEIVRTRALIRKLAQNYPSLLAELNFLEEDENSGSLQ